MLQIGPHRITSLNVMAPGVEALFDDGRKADILFSDPPWGDGNVKFWATKAKKDTGEDFPAVPYGAMLERIGGLIERFVTGHVFLETGLRWEDENRDMLRRAGCQNISRVELLYAGGGKLLPNVLLHGSLTGAVVALSDLHHQKGAKVARECIARCARPGGIVFDPCCGMGYSAAAALANGMEFRGNELNPVRLQKTIARLER